MLSLKRYILLYCFNFIALIGICQNPAHFYLGEDDFSNTNVYSLKYHPNGLLYAATNNGLYVYNFGKFQAVPLADNLNTNSLFSLRFDSKNNLYCSTLKGEIFKLINDSLRLYTTIPKEYLHKYGVDLTFDNNDNLILRSGVFAIYKNRKWKEIAQNIGSPAVLNGVSSKSILFPSKFNSDIYGLVNESIELVKASSNKKFLNFHHTFPAYFANQLIGVTANGYLSNYNSAKQYRISEEKIRVEQTADGNVWLLSKHNGICRLLNDSGEISISKKYLKKQFISCITVSEEGLVFLGTFNHGVIVIPNIGSLEYKSDLGQIGGSVVIPKGKISEVLKARIKKNKGLELIPLESGKESVLIGREKVFYEDKLNFGLNTKDSCLMVQDMHILDPKRYNSAVEGDVASFKALQRISEKSALIATSRGLLKVGNGLDHINWTKNGTGNTWWKYKEKHFRCKTVGYISNSKSIYYTNYSILHHIDQTGLDKEVLFHGDKIRCTDIFSTDSLAIFATHQNGILFIKDGKVIDQLSKNEGLLDPFVKKITKHNNKLYIASRTTFQIYDLTSKIWSSLGKYNNIIKSAISDILVVDGSIWLTSGDKIMALPLSSSEQKKTFFFKVNNVTLGGTVFSTFSEISTSYDKNNFVAELDFRGLLYEKQLKIEYRLNNSEWKSIPATSKKIEFGALTADNYQLNIRVNNFGKYSHHQNIQFTITSPFWQRWWFYVLLGVAIAVIIVLITQYRIKRIRKKNMVELKNREYERNAIDAQLKALRAQMNPHFIFNSINSIQDLVLQQETIKSYDYLVEFSKLVRNTLNFSEREYISINEELAFLETYLSLEKLRFKEDFTYSIKNNINEEVQIPSLIIQPFIENALKHGLLHQIGEKRLEVRFTISDILICEITDNGIGREASNKIKASQSHLHKSFSTEAIKQRLDILNIQNKIKASFITENVLDENKVVSGTKVIVRLPYKN